jgi:hypothetical protein
LIRCFENINKPYLVLKNQVKGETKENKKEIKMFIEAYERKWPKIGI